MQLDILDMVRIRLIGKETEIKKYIEEEYGLFRTDAEDGKKVDITVKFVDDVSSENLSINVRPPVAYDDKGVFFHDPDYKIVRIEIDKMGISDSQVTCDVNFNKHFLVIILEYLIHHLLLKNGCYFCHSSAFVYKGKVVLCPAWRNVGKTNVLLAFLKDGAQYLGDDWVIINSEGHIMSIPKRLNLLFYNFNEYPELCESLDGNFKALFNFVARAKRGLYDLDNDVLSLLTGKARLRVSPFEIFKQKHNNHKNKIDYVFMLNREINTNVEIKSIELDRLAYSIKSIVEFEQSHFHLYYLAYKARTGRINDYLEQVCKSQYNLITRSLSRVENLYEVSISSQHESHMVKDLIDKVITKKCEKELLV
jgi:hypothetical protein